MENLLACRPSSYGRYRELAFEYLPKAGITHVEVPAPDPDGIDELKDKLSQSGLEASSLETSCDLSKAEEVKRLLEVFDTARKMDVGIVFCSTKSGGLPKEEVYRSLASIGDRARELDVVLSMETHPDLCENGDKMLATMRGVDHPNVRINFDTANIYYYNEGVDAVVELEKIRSYVASVHLKDTNGKPKTWYFPTLGEGVVDFPKVFQLLNEVGFHGPFTLEMEGIQGENLSFEETHQRIVDSVNYLRSIGVI